MVNVPTPPGAKPIDPCTDVKELALREVSLAIRTCAQISERGTSESARVAAANTILKYAGDQPEGNVEVNVNMSPGDAYRAMVEGKASSEPK